jgi:hypothetical protein
VNGDRLPAPLDPISVKIPVAVRLTGLSRSRFYELMKSGDLAFAKVGSSTQSLRGSIEARQSRPPQSP